MPTATLQDQKTYTNVHYRIESGYMTEQEHRDEFFAEATDILKTLGFEVAPPRLHGGCPEGKRGIEKLYCHPQDISGYVATEDIDTVKQAIEKATTFKLRWVDTYEVILNYTEDEFKAALDDQRDELIEKIMTRFKTKRRNLYAYRHALEGVRSSLQFMRGYTVGSERLEQVEAEYINRLFDELVDEKQIITAKKDNRTLYRARTARD